MAKFKIDDI